MVEKLAIDPERMIGRIRQLGQIGRDDRGRLCRLAGSPQDKLGRDQLVAWMREAGLLVEIDQLGNIFGILQGEGQDYRWDALMLGSHIDTVIDAGIYDGCYGVLAALEVVQSIRESGFHRQRPVIVAAFTNEEGVRFQPNMMGSLVHAGGLILETALAAPDRDGLSLGESLTAIGYAGEMPVGTIRPAAYVELHVEQGPILAHEGVSIGSVDRLQGISWQRITVHGDANHAGTTPMGLRRNAGHAATRCLIPDFNGAIFSHEWREELWVRFFTGAPRRQRQSVERYNIVKRA